MHDDRNNYYRYGHGLNGVNWDHTKPENFGTLGYKPYITGQLQKDSVELEEESSTKPAIKKREYLV